MRKRSFKPEIMDLGLEHYTLEEYNECLKGLNLISKYLSNNKKIIKDLKKSKFTIASILDVGCGGGQFSIDLAKAFPSTKITAIDIDQHAINFANQQKKINNINNIDFEKRTKPELNEAKKSYDIITASLITHHLTDDAIVDFLKRCCAVAKKQIIINDLHRHWLAYITCKIFFPLFFTNRLIRYDSLLSIKKSFTKKDWYNYLNKAGLKQKQYTVSWQWPFRLVVKVNLNE
jgi:2-polyprenyl-3-methyl-5-hydroxy-6-metoxy-1,4-benzoquinol methylase